RPQDRGVLLDGDLVDLEQPGAFGRSLACAAHLAQLHSITLSQNLDGFGEGDAVDLLDEGEDAAALVARVTEVHLLVRVDVERPRLLLMKRTQADVRAYRLSQPHVLGDDLDDVGALADLVDVVGCVPRTHEIPRGRKSSS